MSSTYFVNYGVKTKGDVSWRGRFSVPSATTSLSTKKLLNSSSMFPHHQHRYNYQQQPHQRSDIATQQQPHQRSDIATQQQHQRKTGVMSSNFDRECANREGPENGQVRAGANRGATEDAEDNTSYSVNASSSIREEAFDGNNDYHHINKRLRQSGERRPHPSQQDTNQHEVRTERRYQDTHQEHFQDERVSEVSSGDSMYVQRDPIHSMRMHQHIFHPRQPVPRTLAAAAVRPHQDVASQRVAAAHSRNVTNHGGRRVPIESTVDVSRRHIIGHRQRQKQQDRHRTALHNAMIVADWATVKSRLASFPEEASSVDVSGCTALDYAMTVEAPQWVIREIAQTGGRTCCWAYNDHGELTIHRACHINTHFESLRTLLTCFPETATAPMIPQHQARAASGMVSTSPEGNVRRRRMTLGVVGAENTSGVAERSDSFRTGRGEKRPGQAPQAWRERRGSASFDHGREDSRRSYEEIQHPRRSHIEYAQRTFLDPISLDSEVVKAIDPTAIAGPVVYRIARGEQGGHPRRSRAVYQYATPLDCTWNSRSDRIEDAQAQFMEVVTSVLERKHPPTSVPPPPGVATNANEQRMQESDSGSKAVATHLTDNAGNYQPECLEASVGEVQLGETQVTDGADFLDESSTSAGRDLWRRMALILQAAYTKSVPPRPSRRSRRHSSSPKSLQDSSTSTDTTTTVTSSMESQPAAKSPHKKSVTKIGSSESPMSDLTSSPDLRKAAILPSADAGEATDKVLGRKASFRVLHAALTVESTSLEVVAFCLRVFPGELMARDEGGDTPLLAVSRAQVCRAPRRRGWTPREEGDRVSKCEYLLPLLVKTLPETAQVTDAEGRLPLHLALEAGHRFSRPQHICSSFIEADTILEDEDYVAADDTEMDEEGHKTDEEEPHEVVMATSSSLDDMDCSGVGGGDTNTVVTTALSSSSKDNAMTTLLSGDSQAKAQSSSVERGTYCGRRRSFSGAIRLPSRSSAAAGPAEDQGVNDAPDSDCVFDTGAWSLVEAFPEAVNVRDPKTGLLPYMLAASSPLSDVADYNTVYELMRFSYDIARSGLH